MFIVNVTDSIDKSIDGPARSVTSLLNDINLNPKISIELVTRTTSDTILTELNGKSKTILFTESRTKLKSVLNDCISKNVKYFMDKAFSNTMSIKWPH